MYFWITNTLLFKDYPNGYQLGGGTRPTQAYHIFKGCCSLSHPTFMVFESQTITREIAKKPWKTLHEIWGSTVITLLLNFQEIPPLFRNFAKKFLQAQGRC